MLESYATENAAQFASSDLPDRLRTVNERMVEALSNADVAGILEHNQAFHFMVYEAAGNTTLLEVIETLWLRSGPYLALLAGRRRGINAFFDAAQSHARIIAGIQARDAAAAAAALRDDIETTGHWFWAELEGAALNISQEPAAPTAKEPKTLRKKKVAPAPASAAGQGQPTR